jgi:hypothetical protein
MGLPGSMLNVERLDLELLEPLLSFQQTLVHCSIGYALGIRVFEMDPPDIGVSWVTRRTAGRYSSQAFYTAKF